MQLNKALKTPLYRLWLTVNLVMGAFYIFVVPPFQSPDEFNHFFKINHILEGHFWGEVDTASVSLGGTVPQSVYEITKPYYRFVWKVDEKSDADSLQMVLNTPLERDKKMFVSFPNTARYTPLAYAPQLVSMGICRFFDLHPAYAMYVGRVANFAFWVLCMSWVFCLMPVYRHVLQYLTLIPGTIPIQATLSADVLTNGLLFVMLALILKFRFEEKPIERRDLLGFWALALVTTWTKIVYFPLVFLLILVPKARFGGQKPKWLQLGIGVLLNLILIFWWNGEVNKMIYPTHNIYETTYHNLHETEKQDGFMNVNPELQKQRILRDPLVFIVQFIPKSFELYSYCNSSYISTVGWESVRVFRWLHGIIVGVVLLYFATQTNYFSRRERWFLVLIGHGITLLFFLSQHLHWDAVDGEMNVKYIGKYYIPIFPLFILAFMGWLSARANFFEKYKLEWIQRGVLIAAHAQMVYETVNRFYAI